MKIDEAQELGGARAQAVSSRSKATLFAVDAGERPGSTAASSEPRPARPEGLRDGAAKVVASQAVLGLSGLASLPVLTRQLGPAAYGEFSLFVALVGFVTYQDVARQLLIREETSNATNEDERAAVARLSALSVTALAFAVGLALLPPASAIALGVASGLHGLGSRDFARLSAHGRVGFANAARNVAWAAAFAASAALSVSALPAWTVVLPFAGANFALWLAYRRAAGPRESTTGLRALATLRASSQRERLQKAALDLLGYGLAASAISVLDRVMLDEFIGGEAFGLYCGAADVALRLHVISSALSAALYPLLAREVEKHGYERAATRFVAITSAATPLYFIALAGGIALAPTLLPWLLGSSFAPSTPIFIALLVALFVHSFGFFATPWQRAQGDFCTQRRAYVLAVCLMVAVGLVAIPLWGAWGAVATFAAARSAELQLLALESLRIPRAILPRWKLAAAASMFGALVALGAWRIAAS